MTLSSWYLMNGDTPANSMLEKLANNPIPLLTKLSEILSDCDVATSMQGKILGLSFHQTQQWQHGELQTTSWEVALRMRLLKEIIQNILGLLASRDRLYRWLYSPNSAALFGGYRPLDKLLTGELKDLVEVHKYLAAAFY